MKAALPAGLKLSSETVIIGLNHSVKLDDLNDKEYLIVEALEHQSKLSLLDISDILDQKTIFPTIKSLIDRNCISLLEELNHKYKPKIARKVHLLIKQNKIDELIDSLSRAPKQRDIVNSFLELAKDVKSKDVFVPELLKKSNTGHQTLNSLVKKNIFTIKDQVVDRIEYIDHELKKEKILSLDQITSYNQIKKQFESKDVVLFHGVTSSGKTEVYVKLIKEAIKQGDQVLYLLPEIALTTQLISRLRQYFGDKIGVYHSKFSQNERVEVWNQVLNGKRFPIILGARSALFLPFQKLGLVIIDEEHEASFKQNNPNPRYNARDTAIVLAKKHQAKTLLGSATPSLESYFNSKNGKYGLVELNKRFGGIEMPKIELVDLQKLSYTKKINGSFSPFLIDQMSTALDNGKQIILFQNRRGFAPVSECISCGWTSKCKSCDVTLTFHKKIELLKCHYCGYSENPVQKCKSCASLEVKVKGLGTEKIEEEVKSIFPEHSVFRMDLDTTSKKHAYHEIITAFEDKSIDILIGTQMITKGLDFDNVGVVGVLNADNILNFPDFRSHERAYQLMTQVAGRSGRKDERGVVIIQTYSTNHPMIKLVQDNNYHGMFEHEIAERKLFKYPPYNKLIRITLLHRDYKILNLASQDLSVLMQKQFAENVLGPEYPFISRIRNKFLKNILLKMDDSMSYKNTKSYLLSLIKNLQKNQMYKSVRVVLDIDPN